MMDRIHAGMPGHQTVILQEILPSLAILCATLFKVRGHNTNLIEINILCQFKISLKITPMEVSLKH